MQALVTGTSSFTVMFNTTYTYTSIQFNNKTIEELRPKAERYFCFIAATLKG